MRCRLSGAKAITALLLVIGALSLGLHGPRPVNAALATPSSCGSTGSAPIAVGNVFECDYLPKTAVTPSPTLPATLTFTITSPATTFFFGPDVVGGLPAGCSAAAPPPPPGPPVAVMTISCAAGTPGIGVMVPIQLQLISGYPFSLPATTGLPGLSTMSAATCNPPACPPGGPAPDPTINFAYQFDAFPSSPPPPPLTAAVTSFSATAAPNSTSLNCMDTTTGTAIAPSTPLVVGHTFTCTFSYPPLQTPSFVVVAGSSVATVNPGPILTTRPSPNSNGFACGTGGAAATACGSVTFTGTAASTGTPSFTIRSFALGAAQPYNTATLSLGGASVVPPPAVTGPTSGLVAAVGCANSALATDIAFPVNGNVLAGQTQFSSRPPLSGTAAAPASLSVLAPNVAAICGAVIQDTPPDPDSNPNTIDGGTITYTLNTPIAAIVESGLATFTVTCGTQALAGGPDSCQGAVFTPAYTTPPQSPAFLSPPLANTIHVALQPGATFPFVGSLLPAIGLSATYTRAGALGAAKTVTTNTAVIGLASPQYQLQLAANPGAIAAAPGVDNGSTLVATVLHPVITGCVALVLGGFVACPFSPALFAATGQPGAESGQVTFSTDAGALGPTNISPGQSLALRYTIHCGPIPTAPPVVIVPDAPSLNPGPPGFVFATCTAVQASLYGAGAAGTATVTAAYTGDITGATALATVTVTLQPAGAPANLSPGCNQVITPSSTAPGSPLSSIVSLIQPGNIVVSVWQFDNASKRFQALYFAMAPAAPVDATTVGPAASLFVCVNAAGAYQPGNFSTGNGPSGP